MAKLTVLGASRGVGLALVEQALAKGHQVTALVRNRESLARKQSDLRVLEGDVMEAHTLISAIRGQDWIFWCVGLPPTRQPVRVFSEGTRNVLQIMQDTGVRRLVVITGMGSGENNGNGSFIYDRITNLLLLRTIYRDKNLQESLIRDSGLDWTILRPGIYTNEPPTANYRLISDLKSVTAGKISRADVAHCMLSVAESGKCLQSTSLLCY